MDVRKVIRNPGWWRLFIVLTGLWYGGWLIGAVVTWGEGQNWSSPMVEGIVTLADGTRIKITAPDKASLILKARQITKQPTPWYMDRELQIFAAAIVLFPWLVFFNLRLMRYVIEGFILERE